MESVRTADGNRELSRFDRIGVGECRGSLFGRGDADDCEITVRIIADDGPVKSRAVGRRHIDAALALDDVTVGENESVGCEKES